MDDFDLLQAYAIRGDEASFAALTQRYVNLVYSAAARQTLDSQTAEDLTQAVFLTLARKASSISRNTILAGWLLRTTRFAAANARRLQQRRQNYEREAMEQFFHTAQTDETWKGIGTLLDEALEELPEKDRNAVVLRFFQQNSLKLVAQKLGTTEDTAQKRVSRAIERLRTFFDKHGKTVSAGLLASLLASNSVQAAPAGLATVIRAGMAGEAASSVAMTLAKMTAESIGWAHLRIVALRWTGLAPGLGAALVLLSPMVISRPREQVSGTLAAPSLAGETQRKTEVVSGSERTDEKGPSLLLHLVDGRTAGPVDHVVLTLVSTDGSSGRTTNIFSTDAQGTSAIPYSTNVRPSWNYRIEAFRDGYVPKFLSWSDYQQDRIEEIPAEYTMKMDPAVNIGGLVIDEQGAPVTGMRIVFSLSGPIPSRTRERLTMMGNYHTEMTDASGRWSCDHVPARFGMIAYRLIHPLFQEKLYACDSPDELGYEGIEKISEADFLAGRATMQVKAGIIIAGMVCDENRIPVSGAKVTQAYDFRSSEANVVTDSDGTFRFSNARPGALALTFQADGFAPVVSSMSVSTNVENLQIVLPAGRTLVGRVIDESGQPIRGATIEAASPTEDSRTLFEWHTKTSAEGRFSWSEAPASQDYAISAGGYRAHSHVTLVADGQEQIVKLGREGTRSIRILGRVLDAENKLPPPSAKIQIWETSPDLSSFTTTAENLPVDGEFRLSTSAGTVSYVLEAQGDGYIPCRVTNEVSGSAEVHITMELARAAAVGGIVLTAAGEPAAGAMLAVCGPQQWVQMSQGGKLQIGTQSQASGTIADDKGHFSLPTKYAADFVAVAHPSGFAQLPLSNVGSNTTITLEPYGRVEGSVLIAGQASSGETVRLQNMPWSQSRLSVYIAARTGDDGSFNFDFIPAGEWLVQREINLHSEKESVSPIRAYSHGIPVLVRSGETSRVSLGGNGRPVIGKAIPPDPSSAIPWMENMVILTLQVPHSGAPPELRRIDFPSDEAFQAALPAFVQKNQAFWTSAQGIAAQRLEREYSAGFGSDGSFRIEDVPSGEYSLKIRLRNAFANFGRGSGPVAGAASLEKEVTIPAATGESNASPVDLGDLQLSLPPQRVSSN